MRRQPPIRWQLDRAILGGRAHLGSALWAGCLLGLGLLLWGVGAYLPREGIDARWMLATLALSCALIVFRRTAPGAVVVLTTLVTAADLAVGPSAAVIIVYGDALYAACVWGRRRLANGVLACVCAVGAALTVLLVVALVQGALPGGALSAVQAFGLYVLGFGSPMITGLSVREYRQRTLLERERARQVERMAELDRRNAVAEERGRVARELHDVIANHLSAIAVQSTAALSMPDPDPERTRRILTVMRDSSLQGLTEMRAMIRVLRGADGDPQLEAVTPRLGDADRLFADARAAGLQVRLTQSGPACALPAPVDAAAYRVLQESLTNALRHADPMRVDVAIAYGTQGTGAIPGTDDPGDPSGCAEGGAEGRQRRSRGTRLVLTVSNGLGGPAGPDGRTGGGADGSAHPWDLLEGRGAGAGLAGMRERVQLLGGRFSAGPTEPGPGHARVWRVRAEIPLPPGDEHTDIGGATDAAHGRIGPQHADGPRREQGAAQRHTGRDEDAER